MFLKLSGVVVGGEDAAAGGRRVGAAASLGNTRQSSGVALHVEPLQHPLRDQLKVPDLLLLPVLDDRKDEVDLFPVPVTRAGLRKMHGGPDPGTKKGRSLGLPMTSSEERAEPRPAHDLELVGPAVRHPGPALNRHGRGTCAVAEQQRRWLQERRSLQPRTY